MKRDLIMARITSIKELQTICDDLYAYFVKRLAQVTEIDKACRGYCTDVCLYTGIPIGRNHLNITKSNNGFISFWVDGNNGLSVGRLFDHNSIEIVRTTETTNDRGFRVLEEKRYINKNGQKTADLKKRAILEDLQSKLETLFKDYL